MIAAVARVYEPGCQADHVIILEGKQGTGKSSALSILGGDWYAGELGDVGSMDAQMQLSRAWRVELAELDALRRADISKIKAFIRRPVDRYRPSYGGRVIEAPSAVFVLGNDE
jgi:putative DNA primase/helicase